MKAYLGRSHHDWDERLWFKPEQRAAAGRWLRAEIAAGRREEAAECISCGQTEGKLQLHSEDYSKPYGDHVGAWPLCFACHMALHCRHRETLGFMRYSAMLLQGTRVKPVESFFAIWNFLCGTGGLVTETMVASRPQSPFPWEMSVWGGIEQLRKQPPCIHPPRDGGDGTALFPYHLTDQQRLALE